MYEGVPCPLLSEQRKVTSIRQKKTFYFPPSQSLSWQLSGYYLSESEW